MQRLSNENTAKKYMGSAPRRVLRETRQLKEMKKAERRIRSMRSTTTDAKVASKSSNASMSATHPMMSPSVGMSPKPWKRPKLGVASYILESFPASATQMILCSTTIGTSGKNDGIQTRYAPVFGKYTLVPSSAFRSKHLHTLL